LQALENQALTEAKPTIQIQKPRKFTQSLRGLLESDADLRRIVERWPQLTLDVRRQIVRMVE
jgi:hypothetical protein